MGSVFLLLTLFHVVTVHRQARGGTEIRLSRRYDGVVEYRQRSIIEEKEESPLNLFQHFRKFGTSSDGWLIARIALAFVMVEGLQIYAIVMQIFYLNRWSHFKVEWQKGLSAPEIDQAEELANLCSPIPASFTGFLFFFVFGTTMESRLAFGRLVRKICFWKKEEETPELEPPLPPAMYSKERRPSKLQKRNRTGSDASSYYSSTRSSSRNTRTPSRQLRQKPSTSDISIAESGYYSPTQASLINNSRSSSAQSPRRPNRPDKVLSILTPTRPYPPTYSPTSGTNPNPFISPRSSQYSVSTHRSTPTPTGHRNQAGTPRPNPPYPTTTNPRDWDRDPEAQYPFNSIPPEPSQENTTVSALSTYSFSSFISSQYNTLLNSIVPPVPQAVQRPGTEASMYSQYDGRSRPSTRAGSYVRDNSATGISVAVREEEEGTGVTLGRMRSP